MGLLGAGLGLTFGAAITSKAEKKAGITTSVMPAFSTAASFLPIAVTAKVGHRVLKGTRKLRRKKKTKRMFLF